ncbi:MAG: hypothetical protein A3F12_07330 [Gammaproteobacteria bacterium RIFCSPHIGHO2_12_FULL_38_14]|nr:MAG: hypothetical protein A3F12_07330 [Gammaproteobacteria bacterium RIFCSPHIGHO2_12_FULL_38_14]
MDTRQLDGTLLQALFDVVEQEKLITFKEEYETIDKIITICKNKMGSYIALERAMIENTEHNNLGFISKFYSKSESLQRRTLQPHFSPERKNQLYTVITTNEMVKDLFKNGKNAALLETLRIIKDRKSWTMENLKDQDPALINVRSQQEEEHNVLIRKIVGYMAKIYKQENKNKPLVEKRKIPNRRKYNLEFSYLVSLGIAKNMVTYLLNDKKCNSKHACHRHFNPEAKHKLYNDIDARHMTEDENIKTLVVGLVKILDATPWYKENDNASKKRKFSDTESISNAESLDSGGKIDDVRESEASAVSEDESLKNSFSNLPSISNPSHLYPPKVKSSKKSEDAKLMEQIDALIARTNQEMMR